MSGGKNRFSLDHIEDDQLEVPHTQLVSRPAVEELPRRPEVVEEGREAPVASRPAGGSNKARLLAEQRFKPMAEKRATSVRFEPWLDDALSRRVMELKLD